MEKPGFTLIWLLPLSMTIGQAAAMDGGSQAYVCYILDAILFVYGLVLTVLYCRLKILQELSKKQAAAKKKASEGVYEGLSHRTQDTYESIQLKKT
ncbi:high affinity immunoglobulin epsilon receptor subunit gamma [Clarias gariepinus]|uniref:high affinity immunoglobulin epsilon receptor subunit gamma n=1 Tax=Clarias gariepinus TaxID=13013 RepID=UPI00234DCBAF|nr:high affinity immunoglobulin epsilon receptor subunit gamma [Clarias gariepinus]